MIITDILAACGTMAGLAGSAWGAYSKISASIEKSRADAAAELARAEAAFRDVLIEREERCRQENHELRNEVMTTQGRLMVVERSAIMAETHLEVRGKLDQVLDHFGIVPIAPPVRQEVIVHG